MSFLSWMVLADAAFAVALVALCGASLAVAALWRLRRDHRVIEAAERLEAVNLSRVVKRYVPTGMRTHRPAEEIAVAKQVMDARRPRWRLTAICYALLVLCGAAGAAYSTQRHLKAMALTAATAKPRLNLDVLNDIQGIWGWRADFMESCQENPQTVTLSPDRKRVSVHYAKPYQNGTQTVTTLEFEVVSATPDGLDLSGPLPVTSADAVPGRVHIQFIDSNSFAMSRSDRPTGSSGSIERCPPAGTLDGSVAH